MTWLYHVAMRLTLVTETFPPEINGVAMTLHRLTTAMVQRGHEVQIVRPRQSSEDRDSVEGNLSQVVVPGVSLPRYRGLHLGLPCGRRLRRLWRGQKPEVVHIATEGPLGLSALRAATKLGLPLASSYHTNFHTYFKHYGIGPLTRPMFAFMRWFHNRTRVTMVPSHDMRDLLREHGFDNVAILARGVDGELFNPSRRDANLRKQWGAGDDDLVVAYVGRVAAEKNIPLAVEAFEAMRQRRPQAKFVLVGDGPARAALQAKHPGYVFAGMQRGEELGRHYASADVLLFPSVTETFGNVITEGMASGLCVLAFDYAAGRQHIRHGENGLIAPLDDPGRFVSMAVEVADDLERVRRLGAAARQTAQDITWDAIVDQYEAHLRQTIEG